MNIPLTTNEIDASPSICIPYLKDVIQNKRWFAEKNAHIENIAIEDKFILAINEGRLAQGVITSIELKVNEGTKIIKRYFIPVLISHKPLQNIPDSDSVPLKLTDGKRFLYFAEHSVLFQKAVFQQCRDSGTILTHAGGWVRFKNIKSGLSGIDVEKLAVNPLSMNFSSSNVLTFIETGTVRMVSKTYKDIRGNSIYGRWLSNPEVLRYEALFSAEYSNIPKLYGLMIYESPQGEEMPLHIIMESIPAEGQAGDVFARALSCFLNEIKNIETVEYIKFYHKASLIRFFAIEAARTIVHMHSAFLKSGKKGFSPVQADSSDTDRWNEQINNNQEQALTALKIRAEKQSSKELDQLFNMLLKTQASYAKDCLKPENIIKAQVHGDLHADQGFIMKSGQGKKIDALLDAIQRGDEADVKKSSSLLAEMLRWLDFEGPPAKEYVKNNEDSRDSLLSDAAGMVQAFWYMANVKLYEHIGLRHENPDDHEARRRVSLALAGVRSQADIPGELIHVLNLWYTNLAEAFITAYLDEVEFQGIQHAIFKKWDRKTAREFIEYRISARAFHELRYETYGRDWGWEAIPGARILQRPDNKQV